MDNIQCKELLQWHQDIEFKIDRISSSSPIASQRLSYLAGLVLTLSGSRIDRDIFKNYIEKNVELWLVGFYSHAEYDADGGVRFIKSKSTSLNWARNGF